MYVHLLFFIYLKVLELLRMQESNQIFNLEFDSKLSWMQEHANNGFCPMLVTLSTWSLILSWVECK